MAADQGSENLMSAICHNTAIQWMRWIFRFRIGAISKIYSIQSHVYINKNEGTRTHR